MGKQLLAQRVAVVSLVEKYVGIAPSNAGTASMSWSLPGLSASVTGLPSASTTAWIFVVGPRPPGRWLAGLFFWLPRHAGARGTPWHCRCTSPRRARRPRPRERGPRCPAPSSASCVSNPSPTGRSVQVSRATAPLFSRPTTSRSPLCGCLCRDGRGGHAQEEAGRRFGPTGCRLLRGGEPCVPARQNGFFTRPLFEDRP